jgi:exonuclease III
MAPVKIILSNNEGETKAIRIVGVYTPSHYEDQELFYKLIETQLKWRDENIIMGGAFNGKLTEKDVWRGYEGGKDYPFLSEFIRRSAGWIDTTLHLDNQYNVQLEPTYQRKKAKGNFQARLDYIFTNFEQGLSKSKVDLEHGTSSDHSPVLLEIDLERDGIFHVLILPFLCVGYIYQNPFCSYSKFPAP